VCNRIITLRDANVATTSSAVVMDAAPDAAKPRNSKSATRPKSKSPAEFRQEARNRDPQLQAHFDSIASLLNGNIGDADLLTPDVHTAAYFLACAQRSGAPALAAKWIINELPRLVGNAPIHSSPFDVDRFSTVIEKLAKQELSNGTAKQVLAAMIKPAHVTSSIVDLIASLTKDTDTDSLLSTVNKVIANNPDKVAQYQSGKTGLLGFFVGQVMRGNPQFDAAEVNRLVIDALRK
jgi:glutaminyl-tRNA synthetase